MPGLRYRVQVRTHGEPWRTAYAVLDRGAASARAATLVEADSGGFMTWPYVRIVYGDLLVALWQGRQLVLHDTEEVA